MNPNLLSDEDLRNYQERGYLHLESFVEAATLADLQRAAAELVEVSRGLETSNKMLDLEPSHTSENPRIRRLNSPVDNHDTFRTFALEGPAAALACSILGGPVRYHHSKLNFKWSGGGEEIKWHQDIQFFPHTNYNVLTIGCYLADTDMQNGPLAVKPGSHNQPLFDQYDKGGNWTGMLSDEDAATIDMSDVPYLMGPAGSITIHNARTLHFSPSSKSPVPRPLLLNCYTSSDAKPYTPHPDPSSHTYEIVRGEHVKWASHDPRPCQIPPDWSGGYTSIYAAQSGEDQAEAGGMM